MAIEEPGGGGKIRRCSKNGKVEEETRRRARPTEQERNHRAENEDGIRDTAFYPRDKASLFENRDALRNSRYGKTVTRIERMRFTRRMMEEELKPTNGHRRLGGTVRGTVRRRPTLQGATQSRRTYQFLPRYPPTTMKASEPWEILREFGSFSK
ncbi:hypothetical protein KM043_009050 [Ampulex compressa]|nr:hypothetical protein KM043_009050 [Ampulex compressa]